MKNGSNVIIRTWRYY